MHREDYGRQPGLRAHRPQVERLGYDIESRFALLRPVVLKHNQALARCRAAKPAHLLRAVPPPSCHTDLTTAQSGLLTNLSGQLIYHDRVASIPYVADYQGNSGADATYSPYLAQAQIHIQEIPAQHPLDPSVAKQVQVPFQTPWRVVLRCITTTWTGFRMRMETTMAKLSRFLRAQEREHQLYTEDPSVVVSVRIRWRGDDCRVGGPPHPAGRGASARAALQVPVTGRR